MDLSEEARESFSAWVGLRRDELLRTAYLLTGDRARAEDALQDALVKVAQRWGRLRDGNPDGYVRQIIYHAQASWLRSRREYAVAVVRDQAAAAPDESAERTLVLRQALARLTRGQRAVIVLRYLDDVTEEEAARVLGISIGTVKSQSSAAIRRLRDLAPELNELTGREGDRT